MIYEGYEILEEDEYWVLRDNGKWVDRFPVLELAQCAAIRRRHIQNLVDAARIFKDVERTHEALVALTKAIAEVENDLQ